MIRKVPVWLEVYSFLDAENVLSTGEIDIRYILQNIDLSPTSVYKGLHILKNLGVIEMEKVGVSYEIYLTKRFVDVKSLFRDLLEAIK